MDVAAAVDVDGGAGEVAGVVAGQEGDDGGDFVGGGHPADRDVAGEFGFLLVGGADADGGVDGAGGDGVDGDAAVGDLAGQGFGESEDGGLADE